MNQVLSTMEHSTALSKNNKKLPETFYMPLLHLNYSLSSKHKLRFGKFFFMKILLQLQLRFFSENERNSLIFLKL